MTGGAKETLVVLDEIHHASDKKTWGSGVRAAFRASWRRLLLSGTPFREDGEALPFIDYIDGVAHPHFVYGYADALADGVVAPVYFPSYGGKASWTFGDSEVYEYTSTAGLAKAQQDRHLNTLIASPKWLKKVLGDASEKVDELRKVQPNAAGLVVARDQPHAKQILNILKRMKRKAQIAISDEPKSHQTIVDFRTSDDEWLVAVRMVSEGVDIPRLRVGAYATNIRTELFFRQFVGRATRISNNFAGDQSAFVYIPDHQLLKKFARDLGLDRLSTIGECVEPKHHGPNGSAVNFTNTIGATAVTAVERVAVQSEFTASELARARRVKEETRQMHVPTETVARLLRGVRP